MSQELWKQLKAIDKKEKRILKRRKKPLTEKIQDKIPEKLKDTLELAFYKSFKLVFEKGHIYIEKTYNKDKLQLEYDLNNYALEKKIGKKQIKRFDRQINKINRANSIISVIEGGALGALGIGLPDIPLFISLIMKNIYEIALSFGYSYDKREEKAYILLLICAAMEEGKRQLKFNEQVDNLGKKIDKKEANEVDLEELIRTTANILAEAMLTAKFIQGMPVVGLVGGVVNYRLIRKIGKYAKLKYKKRYLYKKARDIIHKDL